MSYQRSWCRSEQSTCSNRMFEVSPFARTHLCSWSRHWFTALSIMLWSKWRHSSVSVLSDGRCHGSGSGRLVPAECHKSHTPPYWDLDCSVANPVGWWSWVFQLTVVQPSHRHCALGHCPAGRWRLKKSPETILTANGNWDLWQQFEKNENLVNKIMDSYEVWRRWQK